MIERKRVLDVGQCDLDHTTIRKTLAALYDVDVDRCGTTQEALEALSERAYDLVLVNRIVDGTMAEGMQLVHRMKDSPYLRDIPVMLVSNFESAQQEAVAAGALRGFGKAELDHPATRALIEPLLS